LRGNVREKGEAKAEEVGAHCAQKMEGLTEGGPHDPQLAAGRLSPLQSLRVSESGV